MEPPVETVRAIDAAFGRGGIDGGLARLHPDGPWDLGRPRDPPGTPRPRRARAAVRAFLRHLGAVEFGAVEFGRFEPRGFLSGGARVAAPIDAETRSRAHDGVLRDPEVHPWTLAPDGLRVHRPAFVDGGAPPASRRGLHRAPRAT